MKRYSLVFLLATVVVSGACRSAAFSKGGRDSARSAETQRELIYFVGDASPDGGMLEGVEVSMVTRSGHLLPLGRTDEAGAIKLSKRELSDGVVLLFARPWYFDGAWRIEKSKLAVADELYIRLAPFSVR